MRRASIELSIFEQPRQFVKLTISYVPFVIPQTAAWVEATLSPEPEILTELPNDARSGVYSDQLKAILTGKESLRGQYGVQAGFFHDCGNLSKEQVQEALLQFKKHYNNYEGEYRTTILTSLEPTDNEFIKNLIIAVNNITLKPEERKPFFSYVCSSDEENCDSNDHSKAATY